MDLDEFFYTYPDQDDPKIQSKLSNKREFYEVSPVDPLKLEGEEPKTKEGYFYHQELIKRYMSVYKRMALLWEPGSGKTRGTLGPTELYRKFRNKTLKYHPSPSSSYFKPVNTHITKCIILVKNKNLKKIFRDTIIEIADDINNKNDLKHDGFYQIFTFNQFYNYMTNLINFDVFFYLNVKIRKIIRTKKNTKAHISLLKDIMRVSRENKISVNKSQISKVLASKDSADVKKDLILSLLSWGISKKDIKKIIDTFGHVFFSIDEVHNLRPTKPIRLKRKAKKGDHTEETGYSYTKLYRMLEYIFGILKDILLLLTTATPMTDLVNEISYPMNLLLPRGKKMPTKLSSYAEDPKKTDRLSLNLNITPDQLAKYFNGIISYMRVRYVGIKFITRGDNLNLDVTEYKVDPKSRNYFNPRITQNIKMKVLERSSGEVEIDGDEVEVDEDEEEVWVDKCPKNYLKSQIIVEKCYMEGLQLDKYNEVDPQSDDDDCGEEGEDVGVEGEDEGVEDEDEVEKKDSLHLNARKVRNFVFPAIEYKEIGTNKVISLEASYGEKAIQTHLKFKERPYLKMEDGMLHFTKYFKEDILDADRLYQLSSVFDRALELIKEHLEKPGVVYIFFNLVVYGSDLFEALARLKFDFKRYVYNESHQQTDINMGKSLRVAYLTGQGDKGAYIKETLDVVSRPGNWDGRYIKMVIGSSAISESYSIFNVTKIIQFAPDWNLQEQAIKRGIRRVGYEALKKNIDGDVEVTKHFLCALLPVKREDGGDVSQVDSYTVDHGRYRLSQIKDYQIQAMRRNIKRNAVFAPITADYNIDPESEDWSPENSYGPKHYLPQDTSPITREDESTYILLYSDLYRDQVKNIIIDTLGKTSIAKIETVLPLVNKVTKSEKLSILLLTKMMGKVLIYDRYGFPKYLKERNGYIYLNNSLEKIEGYYGVYYSTHLNLSYKRSLYNYFDPRLRKTIAHEINGLKQGEFIPRFNSSKVYDRIIMFEYVLSKYARMGANKLRKEEKDLLENTLSEYYIQLKKPIGIISETRNRMYDFSHKGQRPRVGYWHLDGEGKDWEKISKTNDPVGKTVYVHYALILLASAPEASSGLSRFTNRLRILEYPYKEWKTISAESKPEEQEAYSYILQDKLNKWRCNFLKKITGPNRKVSFLKDKYVKGKVKSLSPLYLTKNPLNDKIRLMGPKWFRNLYYDSGRKKVEAERKEREKATKKTKKLSNQPEEETESVEDVCKERVNDKREKGTGREFKFTIPVITRIYKYFYPNSQANITSKSALEKEIILKMESLGLHTWMHN